MLYRDSRSSKQLTPQQEFEHELIDKVKSVAITTLEANPSLLSSTRKKSAILVEGHIERSEVYQEAENYIRNLIREQHFGGIEEGIRALRVAEVGQEKADLEREMGNKTDEFYNAETAKRRADRERIRAEERERQEAIEEAQRQERKRLERIAEEQRRKERDERERARAAKKAELAKAYETASGTVNGAPVGDRGRYNDRGSRGDGGRGSRGRGSHGRGSRETSRGGRHPPSAPRLDFHKVEKVLTPAEQKRIEEEAMAELLRDGKKASRNRYQAEPEIDEALAPPPRKAMPSSAIKPIDRDPPPKTLERKDPNPTREENKENKETKPERPQSRFDVKGRADLDRREKPRERSRDRGYSRRDSRDRGRGGSRGRLDRSSRRSRSRDARRRDDRPYDDRDRDRRSTRDVRDPRDRDTKPSSRFDDRSTRGGRRSRSPPRSPRRDPPNESAPVSKPIIPIDPSRDPVLGENAASQRRFIDREAEEKKLIEIRTREAEARAFLQQREEAKAKGLPMPGYDDARSSRDRQGSGTPGLGRDLRDHRRESWRGGAPPKRDGDGFATPGPRDMDRRPSVIERPPSRTGPFPMSREGTPIPTGPRAHSRQREALVEIARRSPLHAGERHMDHNGNSVPKASPVVTRDAKARAQSPDQGPAMRGHVRKDSTEAGEIVPGAPPDLITGDGASERRRQRSRSRERRREDRRNEIEKSRGDSRERRRRDDRVDRRDDRRDGGRDYARDRRDDRDRRPRSRSRDRDRRYRSRSRDRRPRDSGRSFGGRR